MRNIAWVLIFISICTISCAQSRLPLNDTSKVPPNTIRVVGQIKKADRQSATVTIIKIIAQGQGLINALSEGEEVTVKLREKSNITEGAIIEAYLKEKMGPDASQATYVLISFKKGN